MDVKYYLIEKTGDSFYLGKQQDNPYGCYIYSNGEWCDDSNHLIMDHLMGYDEFEDDDSPYKIGNTSIMSKIKEISKEEAMAIIKKLDTC